MDKMCRLCFNAEEYKTIKFFSEEAERLDIKNIVLQHFWFQINHDDNLPNGICLKCWKLVSDFHELYRNVQELHKSYSMVNVVDSIQLNCEIERPTIDCNNGIDFVSVINDVAIANNIKTEWSDALTMDDMLSLDAEPFVEIKSEKDYVCKIEKNTEQPKLPNRKKTIKKRNTKSKSSKNEIICVRIPIKKSNTKSTSKRIDEDKLLATDDKFHLIDASNIKSENNNDISLAEQKRLEEDVKIREFYNISCTICSVTFLTFADIRIHYRFAHDIKTGYIWCCNKKLSRRARVLEHMNWHMNPDAFKCVVCHKNFTNKQGLIMHMNMHTKPEDRPHQCDICKASFTLRYHMMRHFRKKHIKKPPKEFPCPQCSKSFTQQIILENHIHRVHELKYNHICHICAKEFKSKAQYNTHYQEHVEGEKPKIECPICGALLKNEFILKSHLRHTHNGEPIKCELCDKTIANKNSLGNHMRNMHNNIREYKCVLCEKIFKRSQSLKEHIASHTGKSILYTCTYCPKAFNSNANLCKHRKNAHHQEWLAERSKRYAPIPVNPSASSINSTQP